MDNIIFDWSGVVKDCVLDHIIIANKIFKHFGVKEISLEEFKREWRQPYMVFYNKYIPNITIEEQGSVYRKAISESPKAKQYENIADSIKKFKKAGKRLIVITSDDPETILPEIKSFGLDGIFDDIIMQVHDKEEAVQKVIENNSFDKNETVMIGDSNHEIEIAKKLGIRSIAVTWGFTLENKLKAENPDFIVHNLDELEKIILKVS